MELKAVAQNGGMFLISLDSRNKRGAVASPTRKIIGENLPVQSILARGYWGPVKDDEAAAKALEMVRSKTPRSRGKT